MCCIYKMECDLPSGRSHFYLFIVVPSWDAFADNMVAVVHRIVGNGAQFHHIDFNGGV